MFWSKQEKPSLEGIEGAESIAVGSANFIEETKARLGINGIRRRIEVLQGVLREESAPYNADFDPQKRCLSLENSYLLDISI